MNLSFLAGVVKNPKADHKLKEVYRKSLFLIKKLPRDAAYKKNVESIIRHRFSIVNGAKDIQEIEEKIGCGQIALLISQAEAECQLLQKMLIWKPWESLEQKPPKHQWTWPPVLTP